jgi:hypothetical protein
MTARSLPQTYEKNHSLPIGQGTEDYTHIADLLEHERGELWLGKLLRLEIRQPDAAPRRHPDRPRRAGREDGVQGLAGAREVEERKRVEMSSN